MNVCDHVLSCGILVPVIPLTTVFFLDSVSFSNQMELDSAAKKVQFVLIVCLFVLIELCFDLIMSPNTYTIMLPVHSHSVVSLTVLGTYGMVHVCKLTFWARKTEPCFKSGHFM